MILDRFLVNVSSPQIVRELGEVSRIIITLVFHYSGRFQVVSANRLSRSISDNAEVELSVLNAAVEITLNLSV